MNEWRKFMMSNDKDNDKNMRICMVGGQALMEGIMMRGEHGYAQVIRNPEGELVTEVENYQQLM